MSKDDIEYLSYLVGRRMDMSVPEKNKKLINKQIKIFLEHLALKHIVLDEIKITLDKDGNVCYNNDEIK